MSLLIDNPEVNACLSDIAKFLGGFDEKSLFDQSGGQEASIPDGKAVAAMFDGILSIMVRRLGDRGAKLEQALTRERRSGSFSPKQCLQDLLETTRLPQVPAALKNTTNEPLYVFLTVYFARPFLRHGKGRPEDSAKGGRVCPRCAAQPALAFLTGKKEGEKRLWCRRCDSTWPVERTICPFCGAAGPEAAGYLTIDGETRWTIAVCDKCRRYLKTCDLRAAADAGSGFPDADRLVWSSVALDLAAQHHGYREGGGG